MGLTGPARTGNTHSLSHQQEVKYPFGKKGTRLFEVLPRDKKKKKNQQEECNTNYRQPRP